MDHELVNLLKQGRKLEAIKKCQEIIGISFSEAKSYIDEIEDSIPAGEIHNPDDVLITLLKDNRKLEAIKKCQDDKKVSFHEAKQHVEKLESGRLRENVEETENSIIVSQQKPITPVAQIETPSEKANARNPWKVIVGGIVLFMMLWKIWSYQSIRNDTIYEYGISTQDVLWFANTIIPWPDPFASGEPSSLTRDEMQDIAEKAITEQEGNASPTEAPADYEYSDIVVADTPLYWESQIIDLENGDLLTPNVEDAEITIPEGTTVYVIKDDDQTYDGKDLLYATVNFNGQVGYVKKYFLRTHADIVDDELSK